MGPQPKRSERSPIETDPDEPMEREPHDPSVDVERYDDPAVTDIERLADPIDAISDGEPA